MPPVSVLSVSNRRRVIATPPYVTPLTWSPVEAFWSIKTTAARALALPAWLVVFVPVEVYAEAVVVVS